MSGATRDVEDPLVPAQPELVGEVLGAVRKEAQDGVVVGVGDRVEGFLEEALLGVVHGESQARV